MVGQNVLLTGIPRSGTTLTCSLLNRLPDALALIEPMDMQALIDARSDAERVETIARYLESVRQDVLTHGLAPHKLLAGTDTNTFSTTASGKRASTILGQQQVHLERRLPDSFTLVVKHPNAFAALLPALSGSFRCFALVRNPLAVLASWSTLDHPLSRGHAPMAEQFDPHLAERLRAEEDPLARQLELLDWYFERFLTHLPADRLLRYEDLIASEGAALEVISASAARLPEASELNLQSHNASALYSNTALIEAAAERLLAEPSRPCWHLYARPDVEALRAQLTAGTSSPPREEQASPRVSFVIAGMQKCGTTALASFLDQHPEITMASPKEPHLFDAPAYSAQWDTKTIDGRYARFFAHDNGNGLLGEATPIYTLFPEVPAELKRYNPAMKLIVLLRDPVERAISHHYMETRKGNESRPLWLALLLEPLRLRRCRDPRAPNSAWRRHSYRARGLYTRQLANLRRSFPAEQLLVIRSANLQQDHAATLRRVFRFLGVQEDVEVPSASVFAGDRGDKRHRLASFLLRISYVPERLRLRRYRQDIR